MDERIDVTGLEQDETADPWSSPRWREDEAPAGEVMKHHRDWNDDAPDEDAEGAITRQE